MGVFFIDTSSGQVATLKQLTAAGMDEPVTPWFRIQAPDDSTTLWQAVLVKETKGVHIGTLTLRHGEHHSLLLKSGWREIPPEDIGSSLPGHLGTDALSPSPWS
ncbi:MAG: hypothetical protein NTX07_00370 [Solirubrobacterales bacterium]|nr:hypothetical protein [Solirubrobacterales bacterium]